MTRIRVEFDLKDAAYEARVFCDHESWPRDPVVRRMPLSEEGGYPLPDKADAKLWQDGPHAVLCENTSGEELSRLHSQVLDDPTNEQIECFGRYLYCVAFGALRAELEKTPLPLEIEVLARPAAARLDSLPWEMLWNDQGALIAQDENSVSRVVAAAEQKICGKLELPPRVLFLVGELDDQLRPGAEYLAILDSLAKGSGVGGLSGSALRIRSMTNATLPLIEAAVESFSPQIVHIVAHGSRNREGPFIRLRDTKSDNPKAVVECLAKDLLLSLQPKKKPLPVLVIVNACHTGSSGIGDARGFAAELVRGGVPAAIGMSGEVASRACRLFSEKFYAELASQRAPRDGEAGACPIRRAVASGQVAARRSIGKSKSGVDWARPSLFIAENMEIDLRELPARETLLNVIANITGEGWTILGRGAAIRDYEKFIGNRGAGSKRVLAYVQSASKKDFKSTGLYKGMPFHLGKTLLLWELRARALLDGYLPCLVQSIKKGTTPVPNYLWLALMLVDVMGDLLRLFGIDKPWRSHVQRLAARELKLPPLAREDSEDELIEEFGRAKSALLDKTGTGVAGLEAEVIAQKIRMDIEYCVTGIRTKWPAAVGALIMIDDMHLYKEAHQLILQDINDQGFGTKLAPAPVVLTINVFEDDGMSVRNTLDTFPHKGFTQFSSNIAPFPADAEGRAAYSQYLLKQKNLAPSRGNDRRERFTECLEIMHKHVFGVPTYLDVVESQIDGFRTEKSSPVVRADEEAIFDAMQERQ